MVFEVLEYTHRNKPNGVNSMNLKAFIIFNASTKQQYTVNASTWVRAVQAVVTINNNTAAEDWTAQDLSDYNPTIRQRLVNESVKL